VAEFSEIWVFSEKPSFTAELIGGGRSLLPAVGGRLTAVIYGSREKAEEAIQYGADRVLWLENPLGSEVPVENIVPTLARQIEDQKPRLVLIGTTRRGRAVAGRLAARLGTTVITDVNQLTYQDGELLARHMIFGGGAVRLEKPRGETILATAGLGVFVSPGLGHPAGGDIQKIELVEPEWQVTLRDRKVRMAAPVNLVAARKIVCVGRGVGKKEDLSLVEDLARALNAEIACTRPIAEGLNWLPRERYIGVSGAQVRPDLYVGVGVSGQVQHTVGMSMSRMVVAINKDANAPIFSQTDYSLVGDLYTLVPLLSEALKNRKP